jgi:hypothetical protein
MQQEYVSRMNHWWLSNKLLDYWTVNFFIIVMYEIDRWKKRLIEHLSFLSLHGTSPIWNCLDVMYYYFSKRYYRMACLSFMNRNKTGNRLFPVSLFTSFLGHMQWSKDSRSRGNQSDLVCIKLRFRLFEYMRAMCICT